MAAQGLGHVPAQMVNQLEEALHVKFSPGYNHSLAFMSHLWEDLQAEYRPLVFYVGMELVAVAGMFAMKGLGFKRQQCG